MFQLWFKRKIKKNRSDECYCPGPKNNNLPVLDPHNLPNDIFECYRTSKEGTGFDFNQEANNMLETDTSSEQYIVQYLQRIANGCSISHTPTTPASGDCGFHLLAYLLVKSPMLIKTQNRIKKYLNLDELKIFGDNGVDNSNKHHDLNFYLRRVYSQYIKNKLSHKFFLMNIIIRNGTI